MGWRTFLTEAFSTNFFTNILGWSKVTLFVTLKKLTMPQISMIQDQTRPLRSQSSLFEITEERERDRLRDQFDNVIERASKWVSECKERFPTVCFIYSWDLRKRTTSAVSLRQKPTVSIWGQPHVEPDYNIQTLYH